MVSGGEIVKVEKPRKNNPAIPGSSAMILFQFSRRKR